jgi:hypothetical protein
MMVPRVLGIVDIAKTSAFPIATPKKRSTGVASFRPPGRVKLLVPLDRAFFVAPLEMVQALGGVLHRTRAGDKGGAKIGPLDHLSRSPATQFGGRLVVRGGCFFLCNNRVGAIVAVVWSIDGRMMIWFG